MYIYKCKFITQMMFLKENIYLIIINFQFLSGHGYCILFGNGSYAMDYNVRGTIYASIMLCMTIYFLRTPLVYYNVARY